MGQRAWLTLVLALIALAMPGAWAGDRVRVTQLRGAWTAEGPETTRSFTLARLRRHREAFLNPPLPERCLAGDGCGRLVAVEIEA
jgi:hypothetical protein